MFTELMPLLANRTVMITVAREDEKTIRVNIIPRKLKDDENPALTTPLSYTGSPEELDRELGMQLTAYIECHTQLGSTLAQAKAEMEAAAKAAQEEARKKAAERIKKVTERKEEKTVTASGASLSEPSKPPETAMLSLFPAAAGEPAATAVNPGGATS